MRWRGSCTGYLQPPPRPSPFQGEGVGGVAGFTLVETLVAVVITAIIIGAIYGTFGAGSMAVSRAEERADVYQTARILLTQINAELCSAYQQAGTGKSSLIGEDTEASKTAMQFDTLKFVTTGRDPISKMEAAGDICEVTYRLAASPDGEPEGFFVQESFRPGLDLSSEDPTPIKLSDAVASFDCKYLDAQDEWQDEWVDQANMPKAVRVEMAIKPEREGAKPIIVATTANMMVSPPAEPAPNSPEAPVAQ